MIPAAGFLLPLSKWVSIACACQYKETLHSSQDDSMKRCVTLFFLASREIS